MEEAIIRTNSGIQLYCYLDPWKQISVKIESCTITFSPEHEFEKSAKWRPFCLCLIVLTHLPLDKMAAISQMIFSGAFLPEASFGHRVLSLPACVCVRVSVNYEFVRVITHQPFKLGSPNIDQRCKRPWLRALLFCGMIDCNLKGQIELQSQNLPHFELVHAITHHQLKLQFPNLEQKCILALFRSLSILGFIEIDLQFNFYFKPRPNWAFYVHRWHSLVRPASL